ncbi:MAG: hypothetical protein WAU68_00375 [Vitreimonas sp.]
MRFLMLALGVLAFGSASTALAQPAAGARGAGPGGPDSSVAMRQPSLFISPMGEAFRANASGARGVDVWFTAADTDYDSRISHDEFMANANAFFPLADANQDGALTSVEDTAYWRRTAPEVIDGRNARGEPIGNTIEPPQQYHRDNGLRHVEHSVGTTVSGPNRGHGGEGMSGAQAYGLMGDAEPIMSCDGNFDRRVTLAEFDACAERRFAALDVNHDGFITPDEVNQARRTSGDIVRVSR